MEIQPSWRAILIWIYEKNFLPIFLTAFSAYVISDLLLWAGNIGMEVGIIMKYGSVMLVGITLILLSLRKKLMKYYILNSYIHLKHFLGWKRIPYEEIEDVKIEAPPIAGILKVGNIIIVTPRGDYRLEGLSNPEKVFEEIVRRKIELEGRLFRRP
ncbi:MAG: PH domain-containing protein [Candidatus Nanoarchaeia archaeon]|nr:PH domain-containing protein [Candidatus Haiyanarchaeum thermophilum]MCW1302997.1 PH domain-containing protein [Candidatus Haiyanarchaeum thermophilum]MCW1303675.1 PH domain-containing protein [Candidatus Haiyanarchaeum thermophilum]MCW1306355.1 PH domain-containing protein [Candidatus Haiyanarchaeum thermophilum]MCW1307135.1 PH domain-containing protein [Candidatus Haiyanarchaeum thermophilum]